MRRIYRLIRTISFSFIISFIFLVFPIEADGPGAFGIISPSLGSTTALTNIQFTWDSVAGSTGYTFVLSSNADLSSPVTSQQDLPGTTITYTGVLKPGPYYWQVIAYQDKIIIGKSITGTFIAAFPVTTNSTTTRTILSTPTTSSSTLPSSTNSSPSSNYQQNKIYFQVGTNYDYQCPDTTFVDHEVSGHLTGWFSSIENQSDTTNADIINATISLNTDKKFDRIETPLTMGPPVYAWSFGNIPDHKNVIGWVDQAGTSMGLNDLSANFIPGFDASYTVDKTEFNSEGIQNITINFTPHDSLSATSNSFSTMNIHINTDTNIAKVNIISPTSDQAAGILNDSGKLITYKDHLEIGTTYTYTISLQITPSHPVIEYLPDINVGSFVQKIPGNIIGSLASQTTPNLGTWTFTAEGDYDIGLYDGESRNVIFQGFARTNEGLPAPPLTTTVLPSSQNGTNFTESIASPDQISTEPKVAETNAVFAIITVLVFYLAATIFNSTVKENYSDFQNWSGWISKRFRFIGKTVLSLPADTAIYKPGLRLYLEGILVVVLCTAIYWFLDPYFALADGLKGITLFVSLAIGITIATYGYDGIQVYISRRAYKVPSIIGVYPIVIPIAVIFMLISKAINFHPGLIYGFVGAYTVLQFSKYDDLKGKRQALLILGGTSIVLLIAAAAFFLRGGLSSWTSHEGFWQNLVDAVLAAIYAIGLEGLLFIYVPAMFMDGYKVFKWQVWIWLPIALLVAFLFWYVIINPNKELAEAAKNLKTTTMWLLMVLSMVISGLTWVYFYIQHRRKHKKEN